MHSHPQCPNLRSSHIVRGVRGSNSTEGNGDLFSEYFCPWNATY